MNACNIAGLWLAASCLAPLSGDVDPPKERPADTITTTVDVVITPTTVRAKSGDFVRNLQVQDFEVYDNDKLQKITDDLRDSPFSLVVAVQRSVNMTSMLPKIQRSGSVLTDLVVGQDGEIAVVAFDHRVQTMQDFTNDSERVSQALKNLKTGSYSHAAIDAVMESVRMLKNRPRERRRMVLVISEKWDKGSQASLREALIDAEFANVTIYSLNVSTVAAEATSPPMPQRPPSVPTTAFHVPAGAALTPTTIDQNYYLGNWIPLFIDVFQSVENIFTDNTLEAFTRFTGGEGFSFRDDRTLDRAMQDLNEDLHSQYLLSYAPNNIHEGGFHQIKVVVKRPDLTIRNRAGYWIGGKVE